MIFIIKNVTKQASGTGAVYYAEVWAQSQEPTRSKKIRGVFKFAGTVDECVDHAMKAGKRRLRRKSLPQSQEPTRSGEIREVLMFAGTVDECVERTLNHDR